MWRRDTHEREGKGPWCMGIGGLCSSVGSVEEDRWGVSCGLVMSVEYVQLADRKVRTASTPCFTWRLTSMLNTHYERQRRSRAKLSTPWMLFNVVLTDHRPEYIHVNGALLTGDNGGGEKGGEVAFPEKSSARGQGRVPEVRQTLHAGCQEVDYS
jgi:hypothetical protein